MVYIHATKASTIASVLAVNRNLPDFKSPRKSVSKRFIKIMSAYPPICTAKIRNLPLKSDQNVLFLPCNFTVVGQNYQIITNLFVYIQNIF